MYVIKEWRLLKTSSSSTSLFSVDRYFHACSEIFHHFSCEDDKWAYSRIILRYSNNKQVDWIRWFCPNRALYDYVVSSMFLMRAPQTSVIHHRDHIMNSEWKGSNAGLSMFCFGFWNVSHCNWSKHNFFFLPANLDSIPPVLHINY